MGRQSSLTNGIFCNGTNVTLTAINSVSGSASCEYTWTGPNGFFFQGTTVGDGPFEVTLTNVAANDAGEYILTLICDGGCSSEPDTANISVADGLQLELNTQDGNYCEGNALTLSATNSVAVDTVNYTWTGPNGFSVSGSTGYAGPF